MLFEQGYDLLYCLLTYDPQKHINATDALNHEWFRGSIPKAQRIYAHFPHLKFQPLYLQKSFFGIIES